MRDIVTNDLAKGDDLGAQCPVLAIVIVEDDKQSVAEMMSLLRALMVVQPADQMAFVASRLDKRPVITRGKGARLVIKGNAVDVEIDQAIAGVFVSLDSWMRAKGHFDCLGRPKVEPSMDGIVGK